MSVEIGGVLESLDDEHQPALRSRDEHGGDVSESEPFRQGLAFGRVEVELDGNHSDQQRLEVERGVEKGLHAAAVAAAGADEFEIDQLFLGGGFRLRFGGVFRPDGIAGTRHRTVGLGRNLERALAGGRSGGERQRKERRGGARAEKSAVHCPGNPFPAAGIPRRPPPAL